MDSFSKADILACEKKKSIIFERNIYNEKTGDLFRKPLEIVSDLKNWSPRNRTC